MNVVCGVRRTEGTSRKTNKPYAGYIVFYQFDQQGVIGKACDQTFVSDELLAGLIPEVGMKMDLRYNKTGFLTDFVVIR